MKRIFIFLTVLMLTAIYVAALDTIVEKDWQCGCEINFDKHIYKCGICGGFLSCETRTMKHISGTYTYTFTYKCNRCTNHYHSFVRTDYNHISAAKSTIESHVHTAECVKAVGRDLGNGFQSVYVTYNCPVGKPMLRFRAQNGISCTFQKGNKTEYDSFIEDRIMIGQGERISLEVTP